MGLARQTLFLLDRVITFSYIYIYICAYVLPNHGATALYNNCEKDSGGRGFPAELNFSAPELFGNRDYML